MSRWSDEKLSEKEIKEFPHAKGLISIIIDQQFDYWYDPCGKSGHDLNRYLSKRSRLAVLRLREIVEPAEPDDRDVTLVRNSNNLEFLTRVLVASITSNGSMGGLTCSTLRRLKDLLWHGKLVPKTVLDDIVDAVEGR